MLDTLARVHWERGETGDAATTEREAIAALEATPASKDTAIEGARQKLLAECREALARYESAGNSVR